MSEWTVVSVIAALSALLFSFLKPLMALNSTLTRLSDAVDVLEKQLADYAARNGEAHERLWLREKEQDARLQAQEQRISALETG